MTLSQIRRRIDALKREFARELAVIKLRWELLPTP